MTINLKKPDITELKPRITVFGVGGGGGNAVNNMINCGLNGVDFVVANTDAQALSMSKAERIVQLGLGVTEGLGAGSMPDVGQAAAEECLDEILDHLSGTNMCFVTAGMGGGTGTGAAPVVARAAREKGILTVGVVTKPFHFEGQRRMRTADQGIEELQANVDTLIVIPNQNLFRIANDKTTFADAFAMADQVLYSGVACITDLMVKEGLINLDFADVRSVMRDMGKAMMGTGEASGEARAMTAAEAAIANPLLDESSMKGARGLLISITGGRDMTLFEVDEAATRIREEVDQDANIILGATFDESLEGIIRVSVVATGIDSSAARAAERTISTSETRAIPRAVTGSASTVSAPAVEPVRKEEAPAMQRAAAEVEQPAPRQVMATPRVTTPAPAPAEPAGHAPSDTGYEAAHGHKGDTQADQFRPQSRLFASKAAQVPPARPQAPAQEVPMRSERPQQPLGQTMQRRDDDYSMMPRRDDEPVAPRMPQVQDFPPMVREEIGRSQRPAAHAEDDERGPIGLLRRLTNGLSAKREDEVEAGHGGRHDQQARLKPAARQGGQPTRRDLSQEASMYAPRSGHLDDQGRMMPDNRQNHADDDQLEIPAFLRRQAN